VAVRVAATPFIIHGNYYVQGVAVTSPSSEK
jgi:ribosomal protein S4